MRGRGIILTALRTAQGVDAYLEEIMETGVDEMSWDDLGKNDMEWPDVARVTEYRRQVPAGGRLRSTRGR